MMDDRNWYVIAGPVDPEDGTLYWSNVDGWGFLSTATVFSEAEQESSELPWGDHDDPRWVKLPQITAHARF